jgi:osmotically-inducible protein OsmY
MAKLDLSIGAQVHCKDGHFGKLVKIVVDPQTQQVTDLIVERGLLLKEDRVLPVSTVDHIAEGAIHLNIDCAEVTDFSPYREITVKEPAPDAHLYTRSSGVGPEFGAIAEPTIPMVRRRVHQGISAGKTVIGKRTEVANLQKPIGHVDHVVVDTSTGKIADIVIRRGLLAEYRVIPTERIEEVGEKDVLVSVAAEDLDRLARYKPRSEEEILAELNNRLHEAWPPVFSAVKASMDGGVLHLTGQVRSETLRCHAEELAQLEGVIDIQNDLVVDPAVMTEDPRPRNGKNVLSASDALLSDPRTRDAQIDIIQDRGVVTLCGQVKNAEARNAAAEIVARHAGAATVVNELVIEPR